MNSPHLLSLPLELRLKINTYLPLPSILTLRHTNHQLNNEIQQYYNNSKLCLRIDQSSYPGFWRILYNFRKLRAIIVQNFVRSVPAPTPKSGQKFPRDSITKLVLDGMISLPNLFWLLQNTASNLQEFIITHETLGLENLLSEQRVQNLVKTELKNLRVLNLQYLRYPDPSSVIIGQSSSLAQNVQHFLTASFPCLQSFKLYYSLWGNWAGLVQFIIRHAETLQNLELQVGDRSDRLPTLVAMATHGQPDTVVLESPRAHLTHLKSLKFRDDILNLCLKGKEWILDLVKCQRTLETFHFHSPGDMTPETLGQILQNNGPSLSEFVLFSVSMVTTSRLDMDIFSPCVKLTVLSLSLSVVQYELLNLAVTAQIFNLSKLPSTLQKLHLSGFKIDASDLVNFSSSPASGTLQFLELIDMGRISFGLVVPKLIGHCPKLEHLNIRPLVLENANGDDIGNHEVEVLDAFYERFMGQPFDPIDDLDGFEARISEDRGDRIWARGGQWGSS